MKYPAVFAVLCCVALAKVEHFTQKVLTPSSRSEAKGVYELCQKASNCETYNRPDGRTGVRFVPGTEPGTLAYATTFNNTVHSIVPLSSGYHTHVQYGDNSANFGSLHPGGTFGFFHHLYDVCHETACDSSDTLSISSSTIVRQGSSSGPGSLTLQLTGEGQYDGWDMRNAFIDTLVAAADQQVGYSTADWSIHTSGGDDDGTMTQARQTNFLVVTAFTNDEPAAMVGHVSGTMHGPEDEGGVCDKILGAAGAVLGAIDGEIGGEAAAFLGDLSIFCN